MLTAAVLALAVAAGVPWMLVGAVLLAVTLPWVFLAGAVVWAVLNHGRRGRAVDADAEAAFLRGLAAELAAGSSIRAAIVAAAQRAPSLDLSDAVRLADAGMAADRIGRSIGERLATNGVTASAAFRLAVATGGPVGPVFDALARRAEEHGRLVRERRALTAQARLSAWIVGGGPLLLSAGGLLTGLGPEPASLGATGVGVVVVGVALIAAGGGVVWLMLRRAER